MTKRFETLLKEIRTCRVCAEHLSHGPRPVIQASLDARICVVGQAPGTKVHASGLPFDDRSGDRLRDWMGIDRTVFYDPARIATIPMGFCFPGQDTKGGDLPPRKECAPLWRDKIFGHMPQLKLTIVIGGYAQKWHFRERAKKSLTETVAAWRDYGPEFIPTPHPSWRNTGWLKKNDWFERDVVPELRRRVAELV